MVTLFGCAALQSSLALAIRGLGLLPNDAIPGISPQSTSLGMKFSRGMGWGVGPAPLGGGPEWPATGQPVPTDSHSVPCIELSSSEEMFVITDNYSGNRRNNSVDFGREASVMAVIR